MEKPPRRDRHANLPRPRPHRAETVDHRRRNIARELTEAIPDDPNGTPTEAICRALGLSRVALGDTFADLKERGKIFGFGDVWFRPYTFHQTAEAFVAEVRRAHVTHPARLWHPLEPILKTIGVNWKDKSLDRILHYIAEHSDLVLHPEGIRSARYRYRLTPREQQSVDRILVEMGDAQALPPMTNELAAVTVMPIPAVEALLELAVHAGLVVRCGDHWYLTVAQAESVIQRLHAVVGSNEFTTSEARQALGTNRKFIIPLLEMSDRMGWTEREDDVRFFTGEPIAVPPLREPSEDAG